MDDDFEEAVLERMPYPFAPCLERKNQHEHVTLAVWKVEPDGDLVAFTIERYGAFGFDICKNAEAALDAEHIEVSDDTARFPFFLFHGITCSAGRDNFAVGAQATFR